MGFGASKFQPLFTLTRKWF
ncbi:hypothetical protein F383_34121 [Gossypium arboreum]|uniref:Uncharacterized protein n=1 Tax=Gossypium arboreum TaxID=29729 RepID=A0A0B0N2F4_GOSAR|nr:hypothetical protein F383_34121 [Gossypium arboreum]